MGIKNDAGMQARRDAEIARQREIQRQQEVNRQQEIQRQQEAQRAAQPPPPVNPAPDSILGDRQLFGGLQRNNVERQLDVSDFIPQADPQRPIHTVQQLKPDAPFAAALTPYQAVERIGQIPVPNANDAPALDGYIRQTQTIAQESLAAARPPQRADFNGLPPQLANIEYQDSLRAYNEATAELRPTADGISYVRYDQTIDYMFGEMKGNLNSPEFKFIKTNLDAAADPPLFSGPNASLGYLTAAATKFYNQVKTDGPWDHKPMLRERLGLAEGVDLRFPVRGDAQNEVFYDIWSNVHYGYVGTAAGFDQGTLQTAADISEHGTGKNDPVDRLTVQIGIDLWNKYGDRMTEQQFDYEIRARVPQIIEAQNSPEYLEKNPTFRHVTPIREGNGR